MVLIMVSKRDLWRNRPLFRIVIDEIARHGGRITDSELLEIIRNEYGFDVSMPELYKAIMMLELRGFIYVSKVRKELHLTFSRHFITGRV